MLPSCQRAERRRDGTARPLNAPPPSRVKFPLPARTPSRLRFLPHIKLCLTFPSFFPLSDSDPASFSNSNSWLFTSTTRGEQYYKNRPSQHRRRDGGRETNKPAPMCPGSVESPAPGSGKSVCVMDASGPLGRALVDRLLRRGYTVHAATYCHRQEDEEEEEELLSSRDHHRLKVFRADPFDYHAIADAVRGCAGVFCMFNTPNDQAQCDEVTVETEVRAAHNVLEACAQTETVERVVFTSSVTAVVWNAAHIQQLVVDEKCWSDLAFCRKFKLWHALAKTLSEKTAWALAMDRDVDMVSINAGLLVVPGGGGSLTAAHPYLKGAPDMYGDGVLVTVGVDFLADAHVAAYESPTAYGRYLCFDSAVCRPEDAVKLAQMISPSAPRSPPSDELKVIPQRIQNKKLSKLMLEFANGIYAELD